MDKIQVIRQQKQQIRQKLIQLQGQKVNSKQLSQQTIARLMQKKAKLQHQKLQRQKYRKMQQQYEQRKKQMQREKQLEKIRNQKRMIQLQVGMKKIVLNGVQQKVKGINSDQLFTRALLSEKQSQIGNNKQASQFKHRTKMDIKNQFQKYLVNQDIKKQKQKYNVNELNQKRYQLFQKKQQLLMRQVLLKQIMNRINANNQLKDQNDLINQPLDEPELQFDVMKCSKQQLFRLLDQYQIDIQDYIHPIDSSSILKNYKQIQKSIYKKIQSKKKQIKDQQFENQYHTNYKVSLAKWIDKYESQSRNNQDTIIWIKKLIEDILQKLVFQYEKRHFGLTTQEKMQKIGQLKNQFSRLQEQTLNQEISKLIVGQLQIKLLNQLLQQSTEQISKFQQLAIQTTNKSFDWVFNKQSFLHYYHNSNKLLDQIQLVFSEQTDNEKYNEQFNKNRLQAIKNEKNKQKQDSKSNATNIFQTQKYTSQLLNDIKLLAAEQEYYQSIQINILKQINNIEQNQFKFHCQNGLYVIYPKGIKQILNGNNNQNAIINYRQVVNFNKQIKNIKNVKKLNNSWLIQSKQAIFIYTNWNNQQFPSFIGQRINSPCGSFSSLQIFPVFSLLGSLCSIIMGFQKGQILKYNFNRNRITNQQTNLSHYLPIGPQIKTGDQPSFPLNNRNVIQYKNTKAKQSDTIHEFRQFFDYHSTQIINICIFKDNSFISVDKTLKCSLWEYNKKKGLKSYDSFYNFQIVSSYKIYKESQNPRFKDLYPATNNLNNLSESAEQLYKKWMQNQTFLKLQIYNNPKKSSAFFKSPKANEQKSQIPIWKISYDQRNKKILKIYQTFYNLADGKIQCKQAKVWRQYLIVLVERQHVMRNDLKTMKIYTFSLQQKKLRTIGIQFDVFQDQKYVTFNILDNDPSIDYPIISVTSSGKILLFSLLTGQLIKDVSEQPLCQKIKQFNFMNIQIDYLANQNIFYGVTRRLVVQFIMNNKNNQRKKQQFNKIIQISRKKYNNLI